MFEGPVRTKSKLTNASNVLFTHARGRNRSRAAVLAENDNFFLPPACLAPWG